MNLNLLSKKKKKERKENEWFTLYYFFILFIHIDYWPNFDISSQLNWSSEILEVITEERLTHSYIRIMTAI